MEGDQTPFGGGGFQIVFEPGAEFGVCPVDVGIGIDYRPVDVGVIEGIVHHPWEAAFGGIEEFSLKGIVAREVRDEFVGGAVEWLRPVEVEGKGIGIFGEVNFRLGIVISDCGSEECAAEEGGSGGGAGRLMIVDGPEVGLIFGDSTAAIDDVARDEDIVGLLLGSMEGDLALTGGIGGAITEDYEVRILFC